MKCQIIFIFLYVYIVFFVLNNIFLEKNTLYSKITIMNLTFIFFVVQYINVDSILKFILLMLFPKSHFNLNKGEKNRETPKSQ